MESDDIFRNLDWDPCYLALIFDSDFYDINDLWNEELVTDTKLLEMSSKEEVYNPIVEDISIDDNDLLDAVNRIESEWVTFYVMLVQL